MDLRYWISENYLVAQNLIRATGWRAGVDSGELDDYTSRVVLRVLDASGIENPPAFIAAVARRQAVDDIRRRVVRPSTVPLVDETHEWKHEHSNPYSELEVLDQVGRLGRNDARALLGHAMGMRDHELAENGQTLDAVAKRRQRARERMAA